MPTVTLKSFLGIAPNRDTFSGQALVAENVDLSGGGIKAINAPSLVSSGHSGEIAKYKDTWISGARNYLVSDVYGLPIAIYKNDNGNWKVRVNGGAETDLYIPAPKDFTVESGEIVPPATPRLEDSGTGEIPEGTYEYFVTYAETDGNDKVIRESLPSAASTITVPDLSKVKITRPDFTGASMPFSNTRWRVYRREEGQTQAALVGTSGIWENLFYDSSDGADLSNVVYPDSERIDKFQYKYVVAWVRDVDGWITESIPSEIFSVNQDAEGVVLSMEHGADIPDRVTHWRIYRLALSPEATTTFQLVDEVPISTQVYLDTKASVELGGAMQSSYRADNGALVTAGIPEQPFDNMAGPFNGFYVGWIGRDLYLSEPGNPSWWPGAFVVEANYNIATVSQVGSNIAVVTAGGVQHGYGVTPDSFTLSQGVFGAGATGANIADKNFYMAYNGIYQVTESGASLISTEFNREYFSSIDPDTAWMVQEKERLFLFHSEGALVYDFVTRQWSTLAKRDHHFTAVFKQNGEVYGLRGSNIVKLYGGDSKTTMVYQGVTNFSEPNAKRIEALRFYGKGQCEVAIGTVEDPEVSDTEGEVDMDATLEDEREIFPPSWLQTEAVVYRISGRSTVRNIMFTLEVASTET